MPVHAPSRLTDVPLTAICLLCHSLDDLLPFYTERMGFQVRRREESFIQFHKSHGINLCLWEIGHVRRHVGFETWPEGDRTGKLACTVPLASRAEVDATYARLVTAGVAIPRAPKLFAWNAYCFYFADPDGNCWEIYHWEQGGPQGDVFQAKG